MKLNDSAVGHLLLAAMSMVWLATGWLMILNGGFCTTPWKYAKSPTYFGSGVASDLMAALFLSLSAIACLIVIRKVSQSKIFATISVLAILLPPFVYMVY